MLLNQIEVPSKGKLDDYRTNLYAAWGIEAMLGGYPWALSANNGSSDEYVPFRGNALNSGYLTGLGANSVAQLLNHDAAQPGRYAGRGLVSGRPGIVASSSYLGHVEFDGTADRLDVPSGIGGVPGVTIFLRGKLRALTSAQMICELTANFNGADGFAFYYDNAISRLVAATNQASGSRYAVSEFNVNPSTEAVFAVRFDRSQTTGANQCVLFVNGTKQTRTGSTGETSPVPSGNFATNFLFIGARGTGSGQLLATLNLKWMAVYQAALSDGDCAAISALL